ncbi:MAG: hypothetical protein EOP84_06295 [Verrucomicrobiaceae bacterium]|nr:MAG: hypothetical protein EOP84_06295 [Verrucomicrobiaceae bacterium]
MKTNSSTPTMTVVQQSPAIPRYRNMGRLLLATTSVALVSFTAAPRALAAGADGKYEFRSITGSLRYDGDKVDLPKSLIKKISGVVDETAVIKNDTLKLNTKGLAKAVQEFADDAEVVDVSTSVTGPTSVSVTKTGSYLWTGKTAGAIVTKIDGDVFGEDFSGELRTRVATKVDKKTLTIVVTFGGDVLGEDFSGTITIIAKKP